MTSDENDIADLADQFVRGLSKHVDRRLDRQPLPKPIKFSGNFSHIEKELRQGLPNAEETSRYIQEFTNGQKNEADLIQDLNSSDRNNVRGALSFFGGPDFLKAYVEGRVAYSKLRPDEKDLFHRASYAQYIKTIAEMINPLHSFLTLPQKRLIDQIIFSEAELKAINEVIDYDSDPELFQGQPVNSALLFSLYDADCERQIAAKPTRAENTAFFMPRLLVGKQTLGETGETMAKLLINQLGPDLTKAISAIPMQQFLRYMGAFQAISALPAYVEAQTLIYDRMRDILSKEVIAPESI